MQKLNLIYKDKSDIHWDKINFPDGEAMIRLEGIDHKDETEVICRITNAEDLFILCQVGDILNRHGVKWFLKIYYLMSMRLDRVIDFQEPFSLKIIANTIRDLKPYGIMVYHPHSIRSLELLNAYCTLESHPNYMSFKSPLLQLCFPDLGAKERYQNIIKNPNSILVGKKVRNIKTGKIESIQLENPEDYKGLSVMVIDDLCDAGGTFLEIAGAIRKLNKDVKLSISVVHMVNRIGIDRLSKAYDHVYFTNTYKDWDNLPSNCTMFKI